MAIHKDMENHDMCEVVTTHNVRGILPSGCLKRRPPPLSDDRIPWRLRWRIALDVAKGMRYLHSYQPPIVHRDLRSPNIFVRIRLISTPHTHTRTHAHTHTHTVCLSSRACFSIQLASTSTSAPVVAKIGDFGTMSLHHTEAPPAVRCSTG